MTLEIALALVIGMPISIAVGCMLAHVIERRDRR